MSKVKKIKLAKGYSEISGVLFAVINAASTFLTLRLIALRFGGGYEADGLLYLISLSLVFTTVLTGFIFVTLLPEFVKYNQENNYAQLTKSASSLLVFILIPTTLIASFSHLNYESFFLALSKFDKTRLTLLEGVLASFPVILVLSVVSEILRMLSLAEQRYIKSAFVISLQPLSMLLIFAFLGESTTVEDLANSLIAGKLIAVVVLISSFPPFWKIRRGENSKHESKFGGLIAKSSPYIIAVIVGSISDFYFDYSATGLDQGTLAGIYFGFKVVNIPSSLLITPVMEIARVKFSICHQGGESKALNEKYKQMLSYIMFVISPFVVGFVFENRIADLVFGEIGKFNSTVQIASETIQLLAFGVPFVSLFVLNGRTVESYKVIFWPCVFGIFGKLLSMLLTYFLVPIYGALAIPSAKVIIDVLYFFPMGLIFLKMVCDKTYLPCAVRYLTVSTAIAFVSFVLANYITPGLFQFDNLVLVVVAKLSIYILIYISIAAILHKKKAYANI